MSVLNARATEFLTQLIPCTALLLSAAGLSLFGQDFSSEQRRAEAGEASAMTALARRYEIGEGCPRDAGQAILWYKRAVALGEPGAMIALGDIYDEGKCVDQNMGEAVSLFRAAARLGSVEGFYKLGRMIEGGRGVRADREEALGWYRKAADRGHPPAYTRLGDLTRDPEWYRKAIAAKHAPAFAKLAALSDGETARELLARGANLNEPEAIYRLALLEEGSDATKAAALLRKAADLGHPASMSRYASYAEAGRGGVPQSHGDAAMWLSKAADAGDPAGLTWAAARIENEDLDRAIDMYAVAVKAGYAPAMTRLGTVKADCSLFKRAGELGDPEGSFSFATKCKAPDAQAWMERAAQGNHPEALARLGHTAKAAEAGHRRSMMSLARSDSAWLRRAAEAGDPEALRLYAATFSNPGEAVRWVQRAAEAGDVPAKAQLAKIYETGNGVMQDRAAALRWYGEAARGGDAYSMYRLGVLTSDDQWVRKAADAGVPEAMCKVGESTQDREQALTWFRRAADLGFANAWTRIAVLTDDTSVLQRAADSGDAEAKMRLGDLALKSRKNKDAYLLFRASADAGYAPAMVRVGDCHMNGIGASRSEVDGVNWYRRGALAGDAQAAGKLKALGKTQ